MRPELVIFDDLDYFNTNAESGKFLFDVIKQRFERKLSVMITSNVAPADWGNLFGLPRRNAPILDRLLDHTRRIVISIDGSSYRVPEKPTASNVSVDQPGEMSTAQDAGLLRRLGDALSHKTSPDSSAS
jgi:DNA replication protein DnaC